MSETQQTTDNEEQPLDLDAIEGRAADLSLALAIQTVQRQVLARDVPALVARVRELEAELVAVKADNENLLHERLHATEASHELAATCDALGEDAALGRLVRRMHDNQVLQRLRDGGWTTGPVRGGTWYKAGTPEEALRDAALGEQEAGE